MPKRPTRWCNFFHQDDVAVGNLAGNAVAIATLGFTFEEAVHLIKVRFGHAQLKDLTTDEGPIWFGVANTDVSDTQIKAALEVNPTNARDDDQVAIASRLRNFQVLGVIGAHPSGVGEVTYIDLRDAEINFRVPDGGDLQVWVYNASGATMTTGALFRLCVQYLGRWLD